MNNNFYNKHLKNYARDLRNESVSKAEKYIWKVLLSRKQMGFLVKRQRPILNFIVDFFVPEIKLIIEIDGSSHFNKGEYDRFREDKLKELGFELVRFKEGDILQNIDNVQIELMHIFESRRKSLVG
jgi:very-short-patch-repair endonuclease